MDQPTPPSTPRRRRQDRVEDALRRYRNAVVAWLFLAGAVSAAAMWRLEVRGGTMDATDRLAYPALLGVCLAMPVLLWLLPRRRALLELAGYAAIAAYFAARLTDTVLGGAEDGIAPLASLLAWLPLLYVVAFIGFPAAIARRAATVVFLVSTVPPLLALLLGGAGLLRAGADVLLNAYAANLLLLGALTMITALQDGYEKAGREVRRMAGLAETDTLTGLPNRRGLEVLLHGLNPAQAPVGLVLLDFDRFKSVNDRFGHLVGDELLVALAERLRQSLRPGECAARWGGEEFILALPHTDAARALATAERVRGAVEAMEHPVVGRVTVSAGLALWDGATPLEAALAEADTALYAAKAQGRNRVVVAPAA